MPLAKDLSITENTTQQFSEKSMKQVNSYFHLKDFKRIEVNYFVPYFGYNNVSDGFDPNKRIHYEAFSEESSVKAEAILKAFYNEFQKEFHQTTKHLTFSLYEPKIYKDSLLETTNKTFIHMNERINDREQEGVLTIYLINQNLIEVLNFQENLPFVNYIIFNF